jgi:hypothetical protein
MALDGIPEPEAPESKSTCRHKAEALADLSEPIGGFSRVHWHAP